MTTMTTPGGSAPTAPYIWPVGRIDVPAYHTGTLDLVVVKEVFGDTSAHIVGATMGEISHTAVRRGGLADYRPITPEDRLFFTEGQRDGRSSQVGDECRINARMPFHSYRTPGPAICVTRPDSGAGWGWSSLRYLRIEPASQPLSGYVRPAVEVGQRVLLSDGRMVSVRSGSAERGWRAYAWDRRGDNVVDVDVADDEIVYVLIPDVTRLRVTTPNPFYDTHPLIPGQVVTYVRPYSTPDRAIYYRSEDGREAYHCHSSFEVVRDEPATTPAAPAGPMMIEHNGEQYVRLADVRADHAKAVEILHKGADDNGLCRVYDKVAADVDRETALFKMGTRPRRRRVQGTVTVEVQYDFLTDDTYTSDDEAVAAVTERIRRHVTVPERAMNPDNTYSWRVVGPTVENRTVEVI